MALKGNVQFGATSPDITKTYTLNYARITAQGKPTLVSRGVYFGFSLPVYNSDDEELFVCSCVPNSWDGITNPVLYVGGWLDTANTGKKFNLQASWDHWGSGDAIGTTTQDVPVETDTETAAQYTAFKVAFTLDWVGQGVVPGDAIGIRLRRLAATSVEISGEFVVEGMALNYYIDKIGTA